MPKTPLQCLKFISKSGKLVSGLIPVKSSVQTKRKLRIEEEAAIWDLRSKADGGRENLLEKIDYIFFRQFSDGRSSQIAAYVVDNSNNNHDKETLAELHKQVWLQGKAPLLYIAWHSRVDILSCARGADFWDKRKDQLFYNPVKQLEIAGIISDELQRYSAHRLDNGTFWDEPENSELANYDKAAHQTLIQAVVDTDRELDGENNPLLRRLLLLFILIKYLEDRGVFPGNGWFGRFHKGAKSFFDVLKGASPDEVYSLLRFLQTEKFNGDIFDLSHVSQQELTPKNLKTFAKFVEAKTQGQQRYLWEQYSFEHLPVEIISHLYQRFIKGGHGAVYTPPFLAELLLDYTMPYNKLKGNERILDPACGSGVFLVGAFKRLIQHWRHKNNWQRPTVKNLKEILAGSIFGIDLDMNAIDLTAFSLSLAVCDALLPEIIWRDLRFDRLRERNLWKNDFFQILLDSKEDTQNILSKPFNIIVGNPPFESEFTEVAQKIDDLAGVKSENRGKCPDNQVAYLFLEQAIELLHKQKGKLCLIQPSGFLYNRKAGNFRANLFRKHQVNLILDFTSIRKLYEKDPKTIAIQISSKKPTENNSILHYTFRRTVSVNERICFELDHYDYHCALQSQIMQEKHVWRAHLLGGGRLVGVSQQFQKHQTLKDYIENKGWGYKEGFNEGNRKHEAPFLADMAFLPNNALTSDGIDKSKITKVEETHFESPKQKENYTSPLVLIRELETLPIAFWNEGDLAYTKEIVGVYSGGSKLKQFYHIFKERHEFLRFFVSLLGSRTFVSKSTAILKSDIDSLPFPEDERLIELSFWETALQEDVLEYMSDYIRLGQNSDLLKKAANQDHLCLYSNMFVRMLGSIYKNLKSSKPIFLDGLICQPFYFGDRPELIWINKDAEKYLEKLIYQQKFKHLRTVRVVRHYDKNVMLIIKPNRLRYWIRSTAIRDADETLVDLQQQGY